MKGMEECRCACVCERGREQKEREEGKQKQSMCKKDVNCEMFSYDGRTSWCRV